MLVANSEIPLIKSTLQQAGVVWGKSQNPQNSLYDKGMWRDIPVGFIKVSDEFSEIRAFLPSAEFDEILKSVFKVKEEGADE